MVSDYILNSTDKLTQLAISNDCKSWNTLLIFIKSLPYGRNKNRFDLSLVFTEKRGTCSSKHAVLSEIANLNKIPNVKLILGMYKMNKQNTPGIGNVLLSSTIHYIPEAHCYLKIQGTPFDFTSESADFNRLKNDIIYEKEIMSQQVTDFKVQFHKQFVKSWIKKQKLIEDFETIWLLREQCIENLSS